MAFVQVAKSAIGGARNIEAEIRIGWHKANNVNKSRALYIAVTKLVVEAVGWKVEIGNPDDPNSRTYTKITLLEGTYEDAGFIVLAESWDRHGYVLGNNKGTTTNAAFGVGITVSRLKHYVINDVEIEQPPKPVEYTVDEKTKTILIECPDWLRYNPQSVPELPPQPPAPEPIPKPKEVAKPGRPPTKKSLVVEVVNETGKELNLNRAQRRNVASAVARSIRH